MNPHICQDQSCRSYEAVNHTVAETVGVIEVDNLCNVFSHTFFSRYHSASSEPDTKSRSIASCALRIMRLRDDAIRLTQNPKGIAVRRRLAQALKAG